MCPSRSLKRAALASTVWIGLSGVPSLHQQCPSCWLKENRFAVLWDAAQWCLQLLEHSELAHTLVFDIVDASPALQCMSQLHAITLHRVTSTDETVVEWVTDFSSDANAETIVDARYKRLEALDDMRACVIAADAASAPPHRLRWPRQLYTT